MVDTPRLSIGVSGHQNVGGEASERFICERFRQLLKKYQEQGYNLVLYSALALGADQLFVRTALECQVPVEVVIPCAEYEAIFSTDEDRDEYRRLLSASQACHYLQAEACSDDAYLAAGQWIVDQSNLIILAWNGLPARGKGGTGDIASYARYVGCPFVHIHTLRQAVSMYGNLSFTPRKPVFASPKHESLVRKELIHQGSVLTLQRYRLRMPDGEEMTRDVVERPDSLLIVPVSQGLDDTMVLLIEEYDLGAGAWQLKLPGGKVESGTSDSLEVQAQKELRQEIGYHAGRLEKLASFYSHPGYISHKVHTFIASDLEWNPLRADMHEEIRVQSYALQEALAATSQDYRFDPESALALWLYARRRSLNEEKNG